MGLRLDQRQLMGTAVVEDPRDPGRGRHLVLIQQSAQPALEEINAKHLAELKSIDGSSNGRDVVAPISLPEAVVLTLLQRRYDLVVHGRITIDKLLILSGASDIDRNHEAMQGISGRRPPQVEPQSVRALGNREPFIPTA